MSEYLYFLFALLMVYMLPGPDMILLLQTGSHYGRQAGMLTVVGLGLARILHLFLAGLGLGTLFRVTPWTFDIVKTIGSIYLFYLGVKIMQADTLDFNQSKRADEKKRSRSSYFYNGLLTNILNPKALLFCSLLLPQFITQENGSVAFQFTTLGFILVLTGLLFDSFYALSGTKLKEILLSRPKLQIFQKIFFGIIIIGFSLRLALMNI